MRTLQEETLHIINRYCQLAEVQTQFIRDERGLRELGRFLDARCLLPGGESLCADRPGVGSGQTMPTKAKQQVVDGRVCGQEPLGLPSGFKPPHLPFLLACWLMRGFLQSGDAQGYASQFTNDALWMPSGENNQTGPTAIAESVNGLFKTVKLHPAITGQEVSVVGDHAYVIGKNELTIIPKDGSAESHVVYAVYWLLGKVDNQWKIARQIWNQKPVEE